MDEVDGMAGNEDRGGLQVHSFFYFSWCNDTRTYTQFESFLVQYFSQILSTLVIWFFLLGSIYTW